MNRTSRRLRGSQRGAVIVTVAMLLLFLLGFMGIALDFGRLFIVKSELQTALDSCALAAAQELDGTGTAIARAQSAGRSAGNLNGVNLQSVTWSDKGQLVATDITFRDRDYVVTTVPSAARYAECGHLHSDVRLWLLQALGAFSGNTSAYPNVLDVGAIAVATRGSAQSTCPLPLKLTPKAGGTPPNYGYVTGEWVQLVSGRPAAGQVGWASLTDGIGTSDLAAQLNGQCDTRVGEPVIDPAPGSKDALRDPWNRRFGLYGGRLPDDADMREMPPDQTGYAYTSRNWPNRRLAYDGTPGGGLATANFVDSRAAFASCGSNVNACESITGLRLNSFRFVAPGGAAASGGHRQYGTNRRVVTVPIVNANETAIRDYACMLMLQPFSAPSLVSIELEFIGNASNAASPCTTAGLPGGTAGPLVPVLVR